MMNVKFLRVLCLCLIFLLSPVFAQDIDDFDDFASLFDDAEDIVVEEGTPAVVVSEVSCNCPPAAPVSKLTFSGSTSAAGGAAVQYKNGVFSVLPAATFSSALAFDARIDSTTSVHGAVKAAFPGDLQFSLSALYLDSLLGSTWVTLGKKSTSWGNSRIFSGANSSLASSSGLGTGIVDARRNPNLVADSGEGFSVLLRRSLAKGEVALLGYTTRTITSQEDFAIDALNAAFCYDISLGLTGISVLGRWSEKNADGKRALPVLALEQKRTIAGFDFYAQEQAQVDYHTGDVPQVLITAGFYRLWEEHPRMALNVEVQDVWDTAAGTHGIRLGVDAGISRLGKSQAGKIAFTGWYDFASQKGTAALGFVRSNILPHTNLTTGIKTSESFTDITAATTLSLSLSY